MKIVHIREEDSSVDVLNSTHKWEMGILHVLQIVKATATCQ